MAEGDVNYSLSGQWEARKRCRNDLFCGRVLLPIDQLDAAQLYERRWVTTFFDKVLARLEQEFRDSGKGKLFIRLKDALLAEKSGSSYAQLGLPLGLKEDAVKQAVHRMRRRYRELFREEIAQTVAGPGDAEDELKHIFAVLSERT